MDLAGMPVDPDRYGFYPSVFLEAPGVEIVCHHCRDKNGLAVAIYRGHGTVLDRMVQTVRSHEVARHAKINK
jgi:hypothetical protein